MLELQLTTPAEADIEDILVWTTRQFGKVGRLRYEALLTTALSELCEDPDRLGAKLREDIAPGVRLYHLSSSRRRAATPFGLVQQPRHLVAFVLLDTRTLQVLRVLHDSMDVPRHGFGAAAHEGAKDAARPDAGGSSS